MEYSGDIPAEERNSVLEKLQQQMNDLIKQGKHEQPFCEKKNASKILTRFLGFEVKVESVPYDEVAAKCGLDAPPNYLPAGKPARIITVFGTIGCPCAGWPFSFRNNSSDFGRRLGQHFISFRQTVV